MANSPKPGPAEGKGQLGRSERGRVKLTLLHFEVEQVNTRSGVLLGIVTANIGALRHSILDLPLEPLLSQPLERSLEWRPARMLIDD